MLIAPQIAWSTRIGKVLAGLMAARGAEFLSKYLQFIEVRSLCSPSYFQFLAISNALMHNTLSEVVLLDR